MFLLGICIYIYPCVSGYMADRNTEIAIENFENIKKSVQYNVQTDNSGENKTELTKEKNSEKSESFDSKLYKKMQQYNYDIYKNGQKGLSDAWSYEQAGVDLSEFGLYDGIVGILKVPKMSNLKMPIYLGASKNNMSKGVVQLGQTSMPIGGNNTNCVIAGHRGWNGANYFLEIEKLKIGDMVYVENLWSVLSYKVREIKVIKPDDINSVLIQDGKDMVTLFTCHPYWDSTYRYAVFCTRTFSEEKQKDSGNVVNSSKEVDSQYKVESSNDRIFIEQASFVVVPLIVILLFLKKVKRQY